MALGDRVAEADDSYGLRGHPFVVELGQEQTAVAFVEAEDGIIRGREIGVAAETGFDRRRWIKSCRRPRGVDRDICGGRGPSVLCGFENNTRSPTRSRLPMQIGSGRGEIANRLRPFRCAIGG